MSRHDRKENPRKGLEGTSWSHYPNRWPRKVWNKLNAPHYPTPEAPRASWWVWWPETRTGRLTAVLALSLALSVILTVILVSFS